MNHFICFPFGTSDLSHFPLLLVNNSCFCFFYCAWLLSREGPVFLYQFSLWNIVQWENATKMSFTWKKEQLVCKKVWRPKREWFGVDPETLPMSRDPGWCFLHSPPLIVYLSSFCDGKKKTDWWCRMSSFCWRTAWRNSLAIPRRESSGKRVLNLRWKLWKRQLTMAVRLYVIMSTALPLC